MIHGLERTSLKFRYRPSVTQPRGLLCSCAQILLGQPIQLVILLFFQLQFQGRARNIQGSVWIPPPAGMVKVNVDAATSKNSNKTAIAAVVRGADGSFIGASSVVMCGLTDVETLEAMACREGLAVAADLLLRCIRVASD